MKLKLLYFASLREQVGLSGEEVELPADVASVASLRAHLAARDEAWKAALSQKKHLRVAVNQVMAEDGTPVGAGDEVAFFPPVTGG